VTLYGEVLFRHGHYSLKKLFSRADGFTFAVFTKYVWARKIALEDPLELDRLLKRDIARDIPVKEHSLAVWERDLDLREAVLFVGHQLGLETGRGDLALDLRHELFLLKDSADLNARFLKHAVFACKCIEQHVSQSLVVTDASAEFFFIRLVLHVLCE